MKKSNLHTTTWYNPDYRSCPSGIGYIHKPDGTEILITSQDCGPKNMIQAQKAFKPEYLPSEVEYIPGEFWEHKKTFCKILKKHGVTHVLDIEHHRNPVPLNIYLILIN